MTDYTDLIARLRVQYGNKHALEAADALEAQDVKIKHLLSELDYVTRQRRYGDARIAELEAALKPFADAADDLNEIDDAFLKSDVWGHPVAMNITINDLRAARSALEKK